ncbi:MAG: hypothetical protein ABR936_05365 [Bacteroidota bacterium]
MSRRASDAYIKYNSYYEIEQAQLVAESVTNIAISGIYTTTLAYPGKIWSSPTGTVTFPQTFANGQGSFTVYIDSSKFATKDTMQMIVDASYAGIDAQTTVDFDRVSFSVYAMYNVNENGVYWTTGDTCKGRLHTQDYLYVTGNPYFKGPVTTGKGLKKQNGSSDHPTFAGGYQSPVNEPMPPDLTNVKTMGRQTTAPAGKDYVDTGNLTAGTPIQENIELYKNGSVAVTEYTSKKVGSTTTVTKVTTVYTSIAAWAPDGVVLVENMPVHVQGVLNGQLTISAVGTGSAIYIDSSIVYSVPPENSDGSANTNCKSMLGLVTDNNVIITDVPVDPITGNNLPSVNNSDVYLNASIFCLTGGFSAQNYGSRGLDGTIFLVGGIQQNVRGTVASLSGNNVSSGFHKNYDYDKRLTQQSPIAYPGTMNWKVMNWYETTATTNNNTFFQNAFGFLNSH